MLRFLFSLLASCFLVTALHAQTAREVLDAAASRLRGMAGVHAEYELTTFHGTKSTGRAHGTIELQGSAFVLQTADMQVWFDGKTQWSLGRGRDEVYITTPTPQEQQTINPWAWLSLYRAGYKLSLRGGKLWDGRAAHDVHLRALSTSQPISEARVVVDKHTGLPGSILLRQRRTGEWTRLRITSLRGGVHYPSNYFKYNPAAHPGVQAVDLR